MVLWVDIIYAVLAIACLLYVLKTRKKSIIVWILSSAILVIILLITVLGIVNELNFVPEGSLSNDLGMTTYTLFFIGLPLVVALGVAHVQIRWSKAKNNKK